MFLFTKENALSSDICNRFIDTFEKSDLKRPGALYGSTGLDQGSSKKVSTDISFYPEMEKDPEWGELLSNAVQCIEKGVLDYKFRFETAFSNLDSSSLAPLFNMQRYEPSEAFHGFHCERAGLKHSNRVLVWMIYLNTVTDRGETHFYYQNHYEQPVQGKLVVWPSDWTYLHRGVASPTQTKYILTGWYIHV
jgi:hypothetical protein